MSRGETDAEARGRSETPATARCPLCEGPNECAMARPGGSVERCWCVDERFPASLTAAAGDAKRCICRRCLESAED